jgi:hypothetical protein
MHLSSTFEQKAQMRMWGTVSLQKLFQHSAVASLSSRPSDTTTPLNRLSRCVTTAVTTVVSTLNQIHEILIRRMLLQGTTLLTLSHPYRHPHVHTRTRYAQPCNCNITVTVTLLLKNSAFLSCAPCLLDITAPSAIVNAPPRRNFPSVPSGCGSCSRGSFCGF